jgi:hypothetical protein
MIADAAKFLAINFRRVEVICIDADYTAHDPDRPLLHDEGFSMSDIRSLLQKATAHWVTRPPVPPRPLLAAINPISQQSSAPSAAFVSVNCSEATTA